MPSYIEKVEIWSGVTDPDRQTNKQRRKDRATQAPETQEYSTRNAKSNQDNALMRHGQSVKDEAVNGKQIECTHRQKGFSVDVTATESFSTRYTGFSPPE